MHVISTSLFLGCGGTDISTTVTVDRLKDIYVHTREMVQIMIKNMNWGSDRNAKSYIFPSKSTACAVLLSEAMYFKKFKFIGK